ncbi:uncharacterized protein LOC119559405 isoform X2 [Drosophila subpulchrella]|uniref:uncharacterized protein LOC119559405 isoform X2 n=1 Tax=Drosophila subpulchrella TaxID=1486046 RepID=UPI0018A13A2E|nr:uncharacterized protein LOC119559405 isoform X2 [Drosophila subpulchrella]
MRSLPQWIGKFSRSQSEEKQKEFIRKKPRKPKREFLFLLSTPKVALTNPKCVVKPEIVCDRQPASIKFALIDSAQEQAKVKEIRFNSDNLNTLELLQLCNRHVSSLAPPEEITTKVLTKAEKQKLGGGAGGGKKALKKK